MNANSPEGTSIRFGPYEADRAAAELRKNGIRLKLQEQPFQVLWALLERPGEVVTRDELRQRLWAEDTFVDFDNGLNTAINKIREALDGSARHPRFIETVPRRGYRWVGPTPASSEGENPVPAPRTIPRFVYVATALVALALAGGGVWIAAVDARRQPVPEQPLRAVPLTSYEGSEVSPSFSPDGNQVAFAWNGESGENFDIYVQVIGSGSPVRLTNNPADDLAPAWSPDGRYIAFVRAEGGSESREGAIYLIPPIGGQERKLTAGTILALHRFFPVRLSWSSDAKTLFYVEGGSGAQSVYSINIESGHKRRLTSPPPYGDYSVAVSLDGQSMAFGRVDTSLSSAVYVAPIHGADPQRVTSVLGRTSLAWMPDSQEILYVSWASFSYSPALWRTNVSRGKSSPLPILGGGGIMPAVSPKGRRLVYERHSDDVNIWRYDRPDKDGDSWQRRKLIGSTLFDITPQISSDGGRIVFMSQRSGNNQIWIAESDGSGQHRLTDLESFVGSPSWSPDGRKIAFDYRTQGGRDHDVYVADAHAGTSKPIVTKAGNQTRPSWSHDGRWIYFTSDEMGSEQIWKAPAAGGDPIQLTQKGGFRPVASLDGGFVYYAYRPDGNNTIRRVPADGGDEVAVLKGVLNASSGWWDVTREGIYFVARELDPASETPWVLKFFHLGTKQIAVVSNLDRPPHGHTAIEMSPDGKWFLYVQRDRSDSDLMLVENFQ